MNRVIDKNLKEKYRINQGRKFLHRTSIDPPEGTWVFVVGLSSKRGRTGGNSGKADHSEGLAARRKIYKGSVSVGVDIIR